MRAIRPLKELWMRRAAVRWTKPNARATLPMKVFGAGGASSIPAFAKTLAEASADLRCSGAFALKIWAESKADLTLVSALKISADAAADLAGRSTKTGFWPDTFSTDWNSNSHQTGVIDLPNCMSKLFGYGMTVDEAIARGTVNAARTFPFLSDRGTLNVGAPADVAHALEALSGSDVAQGRYYIDRGVNALLGKVADPPSRDPPNRTSGYAPAYPQR